MASDHFKLSPKLRRSEVLTLDMSSRNSTGGAESEWLVGWLVGMGCKKTVNYRETMVKLHYQLYHWNQGHQFGCYTGR